MAKTAPLAACTVIRNTGSSTPYLTVTGSGGGGGAGQMIYTNNTSTPVLSIAAGSEAIRIGGNGDIFQDRAREAGGVFARLERLERLIGIMQRDRNLERDYEPMQQLGDAYDIAVEAAIQAVLDITLDKFAHMEQEDEDLRQQAEMWRALTKDAD